MKLLVKFPTRSRPAKFLDVLSKMILSAQDPSNIDVLVSYDLDDPTMTDRIFKEAEQITSNIMFVGGYSKTKIEAINRDMEEYSKLKNWDIVLLASDDMMPQVQYWDAIVREKFYAETSISDIITGEATPVKYIDLDKALWFFDGHQHRICTLTIMGRQRYERFGYLYHPSYISLWCDNEWTEVNQIEGKLEKFDQVLFFHEHPAWDRTKQMDQLYERNEAFFKRDELNYLQRKQRNFDL